MSGSGGVSVRAGASPDLRSRRARLRPALKRAQIRQARSHEDESVSVACALLCAECGRLEWPSTAEAVSPMRQDPDAGRRQQPCPHCEEELWIDLGRPSTALAVSTNEAHTAQERSVQSKVALNASGATAAAAFIGVVGFGLVWPAAVAAVLTGVAVGLQSYRQHQRGGAKARTLPDRWSMTLPPSGSTRATATGTIETAESIRSPITGTACLAYEVRLRQDADSQAPLATWTLVEQRVVASRIGETQVPEATHLALAQRRLGQLADVELDDAARAWLQARGFSPSGSTLHLFETVVVPGQKVSIARGSAGAPVLRTA